MFFPTRKAAFAGKAFGICRITNRPEPTRIAPVEMHA
jgi:hypothetical protein